MPIDREATLKQADKLIKQGKLDAAIAEYVRLIDDQPQDWTTINALGDVYLRARNNEKAIEQYIRVADHQFAEGFFPKSAALYKKALKLDPENEHILMQLAEIGERQGKFVDAKQFLKQVARQRQARGEERAAAECILRLGSLPEADVESRVAAVQAAQQLGDAFRAVELLKEAAQLLERQKKRNEALQMLADAAEIDPFDAELRVRLAREFLALGQPKRARAYLSFETAGDDPELLLALATVEFAEGKEEDARVAMARVLALAPDREPEIARIADSLMEESRVESAFACVDAMTDAALLQGDVQRAAAALQAFVDRTPYGPALSKLRIVAEELVRNEPTNEAHAERLRRALTLSGEADPEAAVARVRAEQHIATADASLMLDARVTDTTMAEVEQPSAVPDPPVLSDEDETLAVPLAEIDLSTELSGLAAASPADLGDTSEAVLSASEPAADIEDVFAQMRAQSARDQQASAALAQYEEGARLIEQGLDREAIAAFEAAARVPIMRFKAAARLGRFLIDRGDLNEGVEWLERAAEAPPPSPEEGHDLLYELAGALEAQGESARALAILMELDAEADGYRDVRTRVMYLSRAQQAESHRP